MPENKKPLMRYRAIDRCLTNTGRRYGYDELIEEVNNDLAYRNLQPIGKTTLYSDLKDMELEFNAPIEKYRDGNRVFYKYSDPEYSFSNQPLNQEEIEHLKDAALILSRFSGVPGFEWIDEVTSKLELGTFQEVGDPNVISFESNEFLKGKEFIGPLFHAINNHQVLEIKYQTFEGDEEKKHIVHPYHLKEYDNRWYVLGYFPKRNDLITLSVDRINEILILRNETFIENKQYDFVAHFEDLIGIRKEKDVESVKIKLKFSAFMSNYITTKPVHGSQKVISRESDGSLIIQIDVIPNPELENHLFSYKDHVEVLEPAFFRKKIQETYNKAMAQYE
jgi:predicted DNA-binding transcriptional regulator YafY